MMITGEMLIGATAVRGTDATLRAFDPARNVDLEPVFGGGGAAEVARACELADAAFDPYRQAPLETRAQLLEAIADNILGMGDALIERAQAESALAKARLEGERARTVAQLRLFASLVREGRWLAATLDSAQPERSPRRARTCACRRFRSDRSPCSVRAISRWRSRWRAATRRRRWRRAVRSS